MPSITRDEVAHLAKLARLDLDVDTLAHHAAQLQVIVNSVATVAEVAADDVPPMSHPVSLVNVFRDDVVGPSLPRELALGSAPAVEDDRFRVPRILDQQ
jgi:aspartyl-tRNA(Asn)/glutamyl-tRNA(Gln) amidotransferase subunit C